MKKRKLVLFLGVAILTLTACSSKKDERTIITKKVVAKPEVKIRKMEPSAQTRDIAWVGSTYKVVVNRKPSNSLIKIDDRIKYYDNTITVRVLRKDGSEFFNKTFTKSDFSSYIDDNTKDHGCLLGVVFVKAEGDNLLFAASVGSPDLTSDEYIPLVVKVTRLGAVSISKDNMLDTAESSDVAAEEDDEDGV